MKWFFSILLIANIGMFIWLYPQQGRDGNAAQLSQDIGDLRLAGELSAQVENAELPRETQGVTVSEPENTPEEAATTSPPTHSRQVPPVMHEAPALTASMTEEKQRDKQQCMGIGVFEKRSQAELLSVQLLALGLKPEINSESRNEQAGYWVLIPPQSDREAAIAVTKRLEEVGVADLWRFTSGDLAHAISLGLFRDLERAQARKDQIGDLGFNTEVRPRYRQQTQYWINYSFSGVSPITEQKWREFESMFPGIKREAANCL